MRNGSMILVAGLLSAVSVQGARETFSFNPGWAFYRPPEVKPVAFLPDDALRVAAGEFPAGKAACDVRFDARTARQVCLVADSAYQGPFASVAEFYLLGTDGKPLPRNGWQVVYADSEEPSAGNLGGHALDGNANTFWHSEWRGRQPAPPHVLVFDLGAPRIFSGFRYLPRQDGNPSGAVRAWRFFAADERLPIPGSAPPTPNTTWESVTLPHTVRLEPLNASGGRNYQGVCWYRKAFAVPAEWRGRKVYLRFGGAMQVAEISLNGKPVTTHYGGYLPFTLDLTDTLVYGATNNLSLRLDNSDNPEVPPGKPQRNLDFTYFGGLYRNVWLDVLDRLHVTDELLADDVAGGGVFARCTEATKSRATVDVRTDVANEHPDSREAVVRHELVDDATGTVVARTESSARVASGTTCANRQQLVIDNPKLWHPYHPDLYTLRTAVLSRGAVVDQRATRIGLRRIRFTPRGFFINDEKFFALGFNRHQDHPYVGYALPDSAHYRDAKKLRDAGYTSFRSHYPQAPAFMDACDELGIVCIVSNPGWQFFGDQVFVDRTLRNARLMVRRDRNHPSVVLWEPTPNETQFPESYCRALHDAVHEEYPGDQCFTAGDGPAGNGRRVLDVIYGREVIDGKPTWAREWGDSVDNWTDQQGRVRVARGWGELPMLVQLRSHIVKLDNLLKTTGGSPEDTVLGGAGLWAGIDCYRGYHHQPFYGGPLDLFRLPKFDYYFFQSQRPPDIAVPGADGGPMVFIANDASAWSPNVVTVLSNCEDVRFYENGRLLATQRPDSGYHLAHPPFTFQAVKTDDEKTTYYMTNTEPGYHYKPTEYRAEGLIGGKVVAEHVVRAPGVMTQLRLEADYAGRPLVADGADWIRVYARVCDSRGTTHPMADDPITFTVKGEGTIIGDATIGANPVRPEAGIATVLVRSTRTPGTITVRAESFGLKPGELTLESQPSPRLHASGEEDQACVGRRKRAREEPAARLQGRTVRARERRLFRALAGNRADGRPGGALS